MYHIDLSFLKGSHIAPEGFEKTEEKHNCQFQDIIIKYLNNRKKTLNYCMAWGVYDILDIPYDDRKILHAECSGLLGDHYCEISDELNADLQKGDMVIVGYEDCIEIAKVVDIGEFIRLKRKICGLFGEILPRVIRKITEEDLVQYRKNLHDEIIARPIFKEKIEKFSLEMKLVNIHYQFDRKKLYFFYTADGRVDFRELAKDLAAKFRTRIELRQIGVRDEAKKIGGLGSCGREYCCAAFLNNFKRITTQLASEQNLISNMSKLSGPCSKLKCCLSFEAD
ncbi:MAG: hypothetical protein A2V66_06445 [Ignavibacteria bacterium RBG_13_36_8]|nr:MAG: hypothetical protein A2V66_06445 [Ignavibacteria bacterium RBG_13_36_8]